MQFCQVPTENSFEVLRVLPVFRQAIGMLFKRKKKRGRIRCDQI